MGERRSRYRGFIKRHTLDLEKYGKRKKNRKVLQFLFRTAAGFIQKPMDFQFSFAEPLAIEFYSYL